MPGIKLDKKIRFMKQLQATINISTPEQTGRPIVIIDKKNNTNRIFLSRDGLAEETYSLTPLSGKLSVFLDKYDL